MCVCVCVCVGGAGGAHTAARLLAVRSFASRGASGRRRGEDETKVMANLNSFTSTY